MAEKDVQKERIFDYVKFNGAVTDGEIIRALGIAKPRTLLDRLVKDARLSRQRLKGNETLYWDRTAPRPAIPTNKLPGNGNGHEAAQERPGTPKGSLTTQDAITKLTEELQALKTALEDQQNANALLERQHQEQEALEKELGALIAQKRELTDQLKQEQDLAVELLKDLQNSKARVKEMRETLEKGAV
jgi:hypothetical protein